MNVQFSRISTTLEEMKAMPQSGMQRPEDTAALTVAALCACPEDPDACYQMLLAGIREPESQDPWA